MFVFRKKSKEPESGFTATLKLPRYISKDRILGKVIFDYDLERIGQAVDWTYTPEGQVSLVVTGNNGKDRLHGRDDLLISFEYIERAGKIVILSKPLDSLLPEKDFMTSKEKREKAIVALEAALGGDDDEELFDEDPREEKAKQKKSKQTSKKKKQEENLKNFNEMAEDILMAFIETSNPPRTPSL